MATTELSQDFGRLIKRLREERGWTQDDLAKRFGVTQSWISKIESGKHAAGCTTMVDLFKCLGVPPEDYLKFK